MFSSQQPETLFVENDPIPHCQYCDAPLTVSWADLGYHPLSNLYLSSAAEAAEAKTYQLHARFCTQCYLVQVEKAVPPDEIFSTYPYFSSCSQSWLEHCQGYAERMINRFSLDSESLVIEVASNDGYLLQYFKKAGIPVLGIEPAANVAKVARAAGIDTEICFFGEEQARALRDRGIGADHLSAKNVLAHVPDIRDFAKGVSILLKPNAVFTVEFPHILRTIEGLQFDQIYHEHFCYLSLLAVERILSDQGLRVFDVEELGTHGGSLRVFACHHNASFESTPAVARIIEMERRAALDRPEGYTGFGAEMSRVRVEFQNFIEQQKAEGKHVAGYGAAAKGNSFLNYCQAGPHTLDFVADVNEAKIGKYMPGSAIPIVGTETIASHKPAFLLLLPWNLQTELVSQMSYVRQWGGMFVTAVSGVQVF